MVCPLRITFRNMAPSAAIENQLRERVAKLESFCERITSCRVIVEAPHRHHQKGKAFQVRIDLSVPGDEIVINRSPGRLRAGKLTGAEAEIKLKENHRLSKHGAHEDFYVAIRDAFNAAGRKLQDRVRRQGGAVKARRAALLIEETPELSPG
jgi:ribosome-associated translation inhibitor RaiA